MIQISGKVIKGNKYGRVLGFPTANLDRRDFVRRKLKIKLGIYAGCVQIFNLKSLILNPYRYKSAIVIGPLDSSSKPKIEAHLIGFKGSLYGKKITLTLQKYLRPFKKFTNVDALKKQIQKDINLVKRLGK